MEELDLATVSKRTGIGRYELRYVIDRGIIPSSMIQTADDEQGKPRKFGIDTAALLVCAASLSEIGIPPNRLRRIIDALLATDWVVKHMASQVHYSWKVRVTGAYIFLPEPGSKKGWRTLDQPATIASAVPRTVTELLIEFDDILHLLLGKYGPKSVQSASRSGSDK